MSLKHCLPKSLRAGLHRGRAKSLAVVKKIGHRVGLGKFIWQAGLPSEVAFWEEYLASRGQSCGATDEFKFRTAPDSELQPWLRDWLKCPENAEVRVLDVGAGPLTWVGKKWTGRQVLIDAIDPLADAYAGVMRRHNIQPPVTTKVGDGEEVVKLFGANKFDLAFARNCLDHSYDAIKAVTSMIEVTKPGGVIFLWHNQDEAERLCYQGLHQWNFRLQQGELVVWKGEKKLNINQEYAGKLQVLRSELRDDMIQAAYRKL
jgi:SAM-dependent methyltransferase